MLLNRTVLALVVTTLFCLGQARAQERTIRVGVPTRPLVQLVQTLAPVFQAQTGIAVTATELNPAAPLSAADADAALVPSRLAERLQPTGQAPSRIIFFSDVILVGSRAEMARVRGLKDIRTALRWIASARGTYMSSSATLGTRELELSLWQSIGVNVQIRSTWYLERRGDEASVLRQAGSMGAYVLIERMIWAAQENRRGLEVLVEGDPALRTSYTSSLVKGASEEATAWHDWLSSEHAHAIVAGFSLGGVRVFTPVTSRDGEGPPAKTCYPQPVMSDPSVADGLGDEKPSGALSVLWIHESVASNRPMQGANPGTDGGGHDTGDRIGPSHCGPRHDLRGATQPGGNSSLLPVRERRDALRGHQHRTDDVRNRHDHLRVV